MLQPYTVCSYPIRNAFPKDEITARQSFTVQWPVQIVAITYYTLYLRILDDGFAEWNWKLLNLMCARKVWSVNAFNFNKLLISGGALCWNRTLSTLDRARSIVAELLHVGILFLNGINNNTMLFRSCVISWIIADTF